MRSGGARVTSSPSRRICPEVARNSPESRLRKVDLPAPFGPITACTSAGANDSDTPSTATRAPKRRESCFVSRTASAMRFSEETGDAAGKEEDHRDDERPDQRIPVGRDLLAVTLEEGEEQRADHRAMQGALATEQNRHQKQPRLAPAQLRWVDEPVQRRVEVAGDTGQRASQDEGDELVPMHGKSQGP